MKTWFVAVLACAMTLSAHADSPKDNSDEIGQAMMTACSHGVTAKCWRPFADAIAKAAPPQSEREYEDRMVYQWMLAKFAYWAKDFSDAGRFFDATRELVKSLKPTSDPEINADTFGPMLDADIAALNLSTHDYAAALHNIEPYITLSKKLVEPDASPDGAWLLYSAALIGLNRTEEADAVLLDGLKKLQYDGLKPFEDMFPLGPPRINAYDATQRIAVYYMRSGQYQQALSLIEDLEKKRQHAIENAEKEQERRPLWASSLEPADIWFDEAIVYLAQGKDDKAEPLLRAALTQQGKYADRRTKQVLIHMSELDRRTGKNKEADEFAARAAAIQAPKEWSEIDEPLEDTLGVAQ